MKDKFWEADPVMRDLPNEHELYRHFKGGIYEIITIARHTENLEELVIYRDVHNASKVFARPVAMFMSEVDHEKYPESDERFRFTKIEGRIDIVPESEPDPAADVPAALIKFLDAETYEEKLDVLVRIKNELDDEMIDAIAVSLDTEVNRGPVEERFSELKSYLLTMEKYENGGRLRP